MTRLPSTEARRRSWRRIVLRREERTRTTWTFRIGLLIVVCLVVWLTEALWAPAIARSLTCEEDTTPSDALLLENYDADYLVFERAAALRRAGVAGRVLVPTSADPERGVPNAVSLGIAELMARIARLGTFEPVPVAAVEPISLNTGYQLRDVLARAQIRSITVVSPTYRSRRSALVYGATLGPAGITVRCVPAPRRDPYAWTQRWHGIQVVVEQWGKLQYYRWWVLPFRRGK